MSCHIFTRTTTATMVAGQWVLIGCDKEKYTPPPDLQGTSKLCSVCGVRRPIQSKRLMNTSTRMGIGTKPLMWQPLLQRAGKRAKNFYCVQTGLLTCHLQEQVCGVWWIGRVCAHVHEEVDIGIKSSLIVLHFILRNSVFR